MTQLPKDFKNNTFKDKFSKLADFEKTSFKKITKVCWQFPSKTRRIKSGL